MKKKIIWLMLLLHIIFYCCNSSVFATNSDTLTTVSLNNTSYDLDLDYIIKDYDYYFLVSGYEQSGSFYYVYIYLYVSNYEIFYGLDDSKDCVHGKGYTIIELRNRVDSSYNFDKAVSTWNNTTFDLTLGSYTYKDNSFYRIRQSPDVTIGYLDSFNPSICLANYDIKNRSGDIVFNGTPKKEDPQIQNKDDITKLDFDSMAIFLNDYDSKERLYLHRLEVATTVDLGDGNTVYYYNDKVFGLDFFTSYYNNDTDHPGYIIPKYKFELENNKIYYFLLSSSATSLDHSYNLIDYTKIENAFDGLGVSTSDNFTYEQLQQEQQKKQNDQLEENNKTNKNIFETIKEMLSYLNPFSDNFILLKLWDFLGTLISYINPFSDNFLGKKIVELIGNLLKSLFVPSDEYFNNFFSDLKQWFSDRFGFLFYPFELIIDILNRITNINLSEPKFDIPEIKEPSTGKILFKAQDYNFNDLLDTKEFKIMHDIYFVIVDAIIIFALTNLIKSKLKEVETE